MKYLVNNIKWDTDGEDVDLPTEIIVELDAETEEHRDNYEKIELISDYITNETGFCHKGFSTEPPLDE
jgi:hypothetical protein